MIDTLLDTLAANENALGFAILFAASALEYLFPPFPGDTVTLLGGVLVAARGWNPVFVMAATTLGALAGAAVVYGMGRRAAANPQGRWARWLERRGVGRWLGRVLARFRRYGAAYIAVNRFLPGVRAFFFAAAGLGGMPARPVMLWGALSALAWNAAVLVAGVLLGGQRERLELVFERYTLGVWALLGLLLVILVVRALMRRRRGGRAKDSKPGDAVS